MADKRISQLVDRGTIENNDVVPIVVSGATTTNKATISSIQTFMQENLDVGVTSVGITLGSAGTDVSVSGSPITTSGNITINIPTASATARGLVSTGNQTFAGIKTFNSTLVAGAEVQLVAAGTASTTFINNISGSSLTSIGSNGFGFNNADNIYFSGSNKGGGVFAFNNTGNPTYTLQNASGTLAFTSQLDGYVTLDTAQTITAQKVFNTSGSSDSVIITHGSGSGIALDVIKAGDGEGIRVTKTSGSGNAVTITGGTLSAEAGTFSGDLQSGTRLIATSGSLDAIILTPNLGGTNRIEAIGSLPLALVSAHPSITMAAGGTTPQFTLGSSGLVTLTGALNGTSASFSGSVNISGGNADYPNGNLSFTNATSGGYVGISTALAGSGAMYFDHRATGNTGSFVFRNGSGGANTLLTISSTGAATFSSSVGVGVAPIYKFHVRTNTNGNIGFRNPTDFNPSFTTGSTIGCFNDADNANQPLYLESSQLGINLTSQANTLIGGNVGVGTSSPTQKLHVSNGATSAYIQVTGQSKNLYLGYDSIGAAILSEGDAPMYFCTGTGVTERMRITSGGNVGIGVTNPTYKLQVDGNVYFKGVTSGTGDFALVVQNSSTDNLFFVRNDGQTTVSNLGTGIVYSSGGALTSTNPSDKRLKDNIENIAWGLNEILKLRPVSYTWKNDTINQGTQFGFIAQEVEEIMPEAVKEFGEEEKFLGLEKEAIYVTLVKAIQEQQKQIDSLKNQMQ